MKNLNYLLSFFCLSVTYQIGVAQCDNSIELSLCNPIIVSTDAAGTPDAASCTETSNCNGLTTEYFIIDYNNIITTTDDDGDIQTSGPEILGSAPSGMVDLELFADIDRACVGIVPICYDLMALQSLVSNMTSGSTCCAVIETVFAGVCETVENLGFNSNNPPMDLDDVILVMGAFNLDPDTGIPLPISIDFFASIADGVNEQSFFLGLACGGGSSVPIGYCTNQDAGVAYNLIACPLNIELTELEAVNTTEGNVLKWTTQTEVDNDFFIIEKSYDGLTYEEIGILESKGNTTSLTNYRFKDDKVVGRLNYYRLTAVSYSNQKQLSNVVAVETNTISAQLEAVHLAPNPVRSKMTISFDAPTTGPANIMMVDAAGKVVLSYTTNVGLGYNQIEEQVAHLNNGLYMAIIQIGDKMVSEKFVKL